jgi:hypothetical protein
MFDLEKPPKLHEWKRRLEPDVLVVEKQLGCSLVALRGKERVLALIYDSLRSQGLVG